jgi:hypothetical protein
VKIGKTPFRPLWAMAAIGLALAASAMAEGGKYLVVTYYHGTIRCLECLEIERLARATPEERFADSLLSGAILWRTVNYDRPENAADIERYGMTSPSLIISRFHNGRETAWKLLGDTWKLVETGPGDLMDYVELELLKMAADGD